MPCKYIDLTDPMQKWYYKVNIPLKYFNLLQPHEREFIDYISNQKIEASDLTQTDQIQMLKKIQSRLGIWYKRSNPERYVEEIRIQKERLIEKRLAFKSTVNPIVLLKRRVYNKPKAPPVRVRNLYSPQHFIHHEQENNINAAPWMVHEEPQAIDGLLLLATTALNQR